MIFKVLLGFFLCFVSISKAYANISSQETIVNSLVSLERSLSDNTTLSLDNPILIDQISQLTENVLASVPKSAFGSVIVEIDKQAIKDACKSYLQDFSAKGVGLNVAKSIIIDSLIEIISDTAGKQTNNLAIKGAVWFTLQQGNIVISSGGNLGKMATGEAGLLLNTIQKTAEEHSRYTTDKAGAIKAQVRNELSDFLLVRANQVSNYYRTGDKQILIDIQKQAHSLLSHYKNGSTLQFLNINAKDIAENEYNYWQENLQGKLLLEKIKAMSNLIKLIESGDFAKAKIIADKFCNPTEYKWFEQMELDAANQNLPQPTPTDPNNTGTTSDTQQNKGGASQDIGYGQNGEKITPHSQTKYSIFITEVQAKRNSDITSSPNVLRMKGTESTSITSSDANVSNIMNISKEAYHKNNPSNIPQDNVHFQQTACLTYTCWGKWSEDMLVNNNSLDSTREINIQSGWISGQVTENIAQYLNKTGGATYNGTIAGSGGVATTDKNTNLSNGYYTGNVTGTFSLNADMSKIEGQHMNGVVNMTNAGTGTTINANINNVTINNDATFHGNLNITNHQTGSGTIQGAFAGSQAQEVFGNIDTRYTYFDTPSAKSENIMIGTFAGTKQ